MMKNIKTSSEDINPEFKQEKYKDEDFIFTIESWREIGISEPSFIRTNKIITIAINRIAQEVVWQPKFNRHQPKGYIGRMEDHEFTSVLALCRDLF